MNSKEVLAQTANSVVDEMAVSLLIPVQLNITQLNKRSVVAGHFITAG